MVFLALRKSIQLENCRYYSNTNNNLFYCFGKLLDSKNVIFAARIIIENKEMKKDIHPESYRPVVFKDMSTENMFVGRSTAVTSETVTWEDGTEYPLIKCEITSDSHPFYTGKMQFVDTAGRVDKFKTRYAKFKK